MEMSEAKELFKQFEEEDGFISQTPEDIVNQLELESEDKPGYIKGLYTCMNFYDKEFKDESETSWRFIEA